MGATGLNKHVDKHSSVGQKQITEVLRSKAIRAAGWTCWKPVSSQSHTKATSKLRWARKTFQRFGCCKQRRNSREPNAVNLRYVGGRCTWRLRAVSGLSRLKWPKVRARHWLLWGQYHPEHGAGSKTDHTSAARLIRFLWQRPNLWHHSDISRMTTYRAEPPTRDHYNQNNAEKQDVR